MLSTTGILEKIQGAFFMPIFERKEYGPLIQVILEEMGRGNFSFLILVIGIAQLIVMLRKR